MSFARACARYRSIFDTPVSLAGKELTLTFKGINYAAEVWLNGVRLAGRNQGRVHTRRFQIKRTPQGWAASLTPAGEHSPAPAIDPPAIDRRNGACTQVRRGHARRGGADESAPRAGARSKNDHAG
jgi:hypothetical protein